jgi:hypothetical protein
MACSKLAGATGAEVVFGIIVFENCGKPANFFATAQSNGVF